MDGQLDIIAGPMFSGKCFAKNSVMIMHDGNLKLVQNIQYGDYLLGHDSFPRKVVGTGHGKEKLYSIYLKDVDGNDAGNYQVNGDHILVVKSRKNFKTQFISVNDYLSSSQKFKDEFLNYKVSFIDFQYNDCHIHPYILGVYITLYNHPRKAPYINSKTYEYTNNYILRYGFEKFKSDLNSIGRDKFKVIPKEYIINNDIFRLWFLSGIIDIIGKYIKQENAYVVYFHNEVIVYIIQFISRSLGMRSWTRQIDDLFFVFIGGVAQNKLSPFNQFYNQHQQISINGDFNKTLELDLLNPFTIIQDKEETEYYGFTLDGDGTFVLMNMVVTHNTSELLKRLVNESHANLNVLYVNHSFDTRSSSSYSTHNPLYKREISNHNVTFTVAKNISEISDEEYKKYDVIGFDEAQFFEDIVNVIHLVEDLKKHVIIAGLNANFKREPFGDLYKLEPYSDSYTKLNAYCKICASQKIKSIAHFTKRLSSSNSIIEIGGDDLYIPVCRKCYQN